MVLTYVQQNKNNRMFSKLKTVMHPKTFFKKKTEKILHRVRKDTASYILDKSHLDKDERRETDHEVGGWEVVNIWEKLKEGKI